MLVKEFVIGRKGPINSGSKVNFYQEIKLFLSNEMIGNHLKLYISLHRKKFKTYCGRKRMQKCRRVSKLIGVCAHARACA